MQRRSRKTTAERARSRGELAAVVASRRQELDLTQGELADLAGVARGPIVSLEAGRNVSLDVLLAVLHTLGLHLEVVRGAAASVRVGAALARHYDLDSTADSA